MTNQMKASYGPFTRLRSALNDAHGHRPTASDVLTTHLKTRKGPSWTSFFVRYDSLLNDHFGYSHFNWEITVKNYEKPHETINYHILRTGCYPYIKYHCTRRPYTDLKFEDTFFKFIKVLNLGLPTLAYGIAATFLIKHVEEIEVGGQKIKIFFLIPEDT